MQESNKVLACDRISVSVSSSVVYIKDRGKEPVNFIE